MDRVPHWLREVLTLEEAYRWRALAAGGGDGLVVSGAAALVVRLRHRMCQELTWGDPDGLLREPGMVAGLAVASLDDALVAVFAAVAGDPGAAGEPAADLMALELRTPLRLEEGLIMFGLCHPQVEPERVVSGLAAGAESGSDEVARYWRRRLPEVAASLQVRGFVRRAPVPQQRSAAYRPALTLGSSGRVWVDPHERDGQTVAGYWRRR